MVVRLACERKQLERSYCRQESKLCPQLRVFMLRIVSYGRGRCEMNEWMNEWMNGKKRDESGEWG